MVTPCKTLLSSLARFLRRKLPKFLTILLMLPTPLLVGQTAVAPTSPLLLQLEESIKNAKTAQEQAQILEKFVANLPGNQAPLLEGNCLTFIFLDKPGNWWSPLHEIAINGDFTGWFQSAPMQQLADTSLYFWSLENVPPTARVEYIFQVNGQGIRDPLNPDRVSNGMGGENSYFAMSGYKPWVIPQQKQPAGTIISLGLASKILKNRRQVHVYTPAGYDHRSDQRYPVLYVHDGTQYLQRTQIAQTADYLIHVGKIPAIIMVLVDPVNRDLEYGRGADYTRFVLDELIPYIGQHYRISNAPQQTACMGASLGGLIVLHLGFTHPEIFGLVASQSGAFAIGTPNMIEDMARCSRLPVKLYLDVGLYDLQHYDENLLTDNRLMQEIVRHKEYTFFYHEYAGGHNWTCWRDQIPVLLEYLFGKK